MSKRQVIILWAVAAVLGLLILVIKLTQKDPDQIATERKPGETLFESFPGDQVHQVVIQGSEHSLTIEKSGEQWVLKERDDYPAETTLVLGLIRTISELEITRAIEAGPSLAPRFGMDPEADTYLDRGIEIGFYSKSKEELARVTLGKHIDGGGNAGVMGGGKTAGRYIRNHADQSGFYASSETFPAISDTPTQWLRDRFINPEKIRSIEVTKKDSDETEWHLRRDSEEAAFQVVGGKPNEVANTNLANRLGGLFAYARFEDVIAAKEVPKLSAKEGKVRATIQTLEGFTYKVSLIPTADEADEYLLQVTVEAELPKARMKQPNENAADAAKMDKAFAERRQQLQDKLNEAKFFEGRTYLMAKSSVDLLLYNRGEMVVSVAPKTPAPGEVPPALLPPAQP